MVPPTFQPLAKGYPYLAPLLVVAAVSCAAWVLTGTAFQEDRALADLADAAREQERATLRIALLANRGPGARPELEAEAAGMRSSLRHLDDQSEPLQALLPAHAHRSAASIGAEAISFLALAEHPDATADAITRKSESLAAQLHALRIVAEAATDDRHRQLRALEHGWLMATLLTLAALGLAYFAPAEKRRARREAHLARDGAGAREDESVLRIVLNQMGDGLVITDPSGGVTRVVSDQFVEWFGAVVPGTSLQAVLPEFGVEFSPERVTGTTLTRAGRTFEVRVLPFVTPAKEQRFLFVFRDDTTENQFAEARARESLAMAEHFHGDRALFEAFREEILHMLQCISQTTDDRTRLTRIQMLRGAVSGVGFRQLSGLAAKIIAQYEAGRPVPDAVARLETLLMDYLRLVDESIEQRA